MRASFLSLSRERKEGFLFFLRLTFLWEKAQLFCSWSRQQKMWESLDYAACYYFCCFYKGLDAFQQFAKKWQKSSVSDAKNCGICFHVKRGTKWKTFLCKESCKSCIHDYNILSLSHVRVAAAKFKREVVFWRSQCYRFWKLIKIEQATFCNLCSRMCLCIARLWIVTVMLINILLGYNSFWWCKLCSKAQQY